MTEGTKAPTIRQLIWVPAGITLAVTLVRLVGELQRWSPALFSREAGGGAALIGISWLPPVFGTYFAWKLAGGGQGPRSKAMAILFAVIGIVVFVAVIAATVLSGLAAVSRIAVIALASPICIWLASRGWPALARAGIAYGLAARVPVAALMLVAMTAGWGTHYELGSPDFPEMALLPKWFWIGLLPQLAFWLAYTVLTGSLLGSVAVALFHRQKPAS